MKILITGGCGFLGSNLAAYGIKKGFNMTIFDNLSRIGSNSNLEWLRTIGSIEFIYGDVRNQNDVNSVISKGNFDVVIHLAGQVAMTTSISNPYKDFETNTLGTINVLEAIRKFSENSIIIFSSTNKVYGDLEQYTYEENDKRYICKEYTMGFDENIPLDFRSPYGCSKGAADQYMLDYSRIYGIKTVVFRHSSMYGGRQFATSDQGWIGWFCKKAIERKKNPDCRPFEIAGNGKQVRDLLHVKDMINLYYMAIDNIEKVVGQVFNIGGGMERSLSLLELFEILEVRLGICMKYVRLPARISDQKVFVANTTKISETIGWKPIVEVYEGIDKMLQWAEETI